MAKKLEELRWVPMWVSHLGAIKGCLDYLKIDVSEAWLYGGTGHAFIINVSKDSCPSGPTAWVTERIFKLGRNLGYTFDGVFANKSMPDFQDKKRQAWKHVRESIDEGIPCYGWELDMAEFQNVYGYDDVGYHYRGPGCEEGKGPRPWETLGETEIGVIEMYSIRPGTAAPPGKTVKAALEFALEHSKGPEKWIFPNYRSGLTGYDIWTTGVEESVAGRDGLAYNASVWYACRRNGVDFLNEAKERIDGLESEFNEAIEHYSVVEENLRMVTELHPFAWPPDFSVILEDADKRTKIVSYLRNARAAEESGLEALRKIVGRL